MARNRMLNPEFWLDEGIAELSPLARLLYMGLWGICDDNYATLPNRPKWIKAQVFPYEDIDTPRLLDELSLSGKLIKFEAEDGEEYFYIKNFFKYQKVDKPSKPKYPQFVEKKRVLPDSSPTTRAEEKISKVKIREDKYTTDVVATDVADPINRLITLFRDINPNYERLYANKAQRLALERMVKKHTSEKIERAIRALKDVTARPYSPTITTPIELENKMGQLIAFMNKERSSVPKIAVMPT